MQSSSIGSSSRAAHLIFGTECLVQGHILVFVCCLWTKTQQFLYLHPYRLHTHLMIKLLRCSISNNFSADFPEESVQLPIFLDSCRQNEIVVTREGSEKYFKKWKTGMYDWLKGYLSHIFPISLLLSKAKIKCSSLGIGNKYLKK